MPEGSPPLVAPGAVFLVPDGRAAAFAEQPRFEPVEAGAAEQPRFEPVEAGAAEGDTEATAGVDAELLDWQAAQQLAEWIRNRGAGDDRNRTDIESGRWRRGDRGGARKDAPPGVALHWTCSGSKSQPHARHKVGSLILARYLGSELFVIDASRDGSLTRDSWAPSRDEVSRIQYRLRCPACGRDEVLTYERARDWLLLLAKSGSHQVRAEIDEVSETRRRRQDPTRSAHSGIG